jgi:EmrB/QacA subfamily drug resistance transporter
MSKHAGAVMFRPLDVSGPVQSRDVPQAMAADPRRWRVLWTVVAAQFMFVVDAFVVNVAIPTIRADLGASAAEIEAVIAIYLIAYATLVIIGGRLGDLYGVKSVFLSGLIGFTVASVACGLARSGAELIAARLVQGATAALMVPQVLATIHVLFPDAERGRAFAIYGVALGLGGAVGFLLGGLLVTLDVAGLGWRTVFFVNVPAGLTIAWVAWRLMPRVARRLRVPLDLAGATVLFAGLLCVVGPLLLGRDVGWAAWLWLVMLLGILVIAGFLWLERRIERQGGLPLITSALVGDRHFLQGLGAAFCFFCGNLSFYLVLTLFLQGSRGYSAWDAGLTVVPLALAFVLGSRHGMTWSAARGAKVLIAGCALQIVGLGAVALLADLIPTYGMLVLALALTVFGYGQGVVMAPLSSTVLSTVQKANAGSGAGIYATAAQIGNAAGVAAIGGLFFTVQEQLSDRAAFPLALAAVGAMVAVSAVLLAWRGRVGRAS